MCGTCELVQEALLLLIREQKKKLQSLSELMDEESRASGFLLELIKKADNRKWFEEQIINAKPEPEYGINKENLDSFRDYFEVC